jgi:tetratricopeptide (TPR) repeat protein
MFKEAVAAIEKGENTRGRDLLTRLIKVNPDNPEYWLWMSAVVESTRERIYCLKEVLRIDPENSLAQRGLAMFGAMPVNPKLTIPIQMQRRRWEVKLPIIEKEKPIISWMQLLLTIVVVLILAGVSTSIYLVTRKTEGAIFVAFQPALFTPNTSSTNSLTPTPARPSNITPQKQATNSPMPLIMLLKATYTPTPIYVSTPRQIEAYKIALRSYGRGEYDKALYNLNQVLTSEPKAPDIQFHLGEIYRLSGQYSQAIQAYNTTLTLDKNFAPAYVGLAQTYMTSNTARWQEAERSLQKAIQLDGQMPAAYLELAKLYVFREDAQAVLDQLGLSPPAVLDSPFYYLYKAQAELLLNQSDQAVESARRANEMDITILDTYLVLGQALMQAGLYKDAIQPLLTYITYGSENQEIWGLLGVAYGANNQFEDALACFDKAIALNRYNFEAIYQRGRIYLLRKDGENARKDLQMAVNIKPNSFDANMALGRAFMLLEVYGNAWKQFATSEAFASTDTQKVEIFYWRGQSLEKLNQIIPALKDYQALLDLPPQSVPSAYVEFAQERMSALSTPTITPSPVLFTPTSTAVPTSSALPSSATNTPTQTRTMLPSSTFTSTPTFTPSKSPTP